MTKMYRWQDFFGGGLSMNIIWKMHFIGVTNKRKNRREKKE